MKKALSLLLPLALGAAAQDPDGAALYKRHCASCHDQPSAARRPSRQDLGAMTSEAVVKAMAVGSMEHMAAKLADAEKAAIAVFVTGKPLAGSKPEVGGRCAAAAPALRDPLAGPRWNGWGVDTDNSRYQKIEMTRLSKDGVPRLQLKWAFAFPGATRVFAQPSVVGGRVFVGSQSGTVYSLDARSGCVFWEHKAQADVRSAISIGPWTKANPQRYAAYFGDGKASVYAVDAQSGELLWKTPVDSHAVARITGAPLLHAGRLYVPVSSTEEVLGGRAQYECCTFRGSVVALDALTGQQLWKAYTIPDEPKPIRKNSAGTQLFGPSGGAVWTTPTLDAKRGLLYVSTGNAYTEPDVPSTSAIVALELKTGKLVWSRQPLPGDRWNFSCSTPDKVNCADPAGPDFDFGASPILRELGGGRRILIAGQKSGVVYGLDPDAEGKIVWQARVGAGSELGGIEWGLAADTSAVYVANSDVIGKKRDEAGGLYAFKLATGEKLWFAPPKPECNDVTKRGCSGAQSAAVTVIPGAVFSGGIDGHIRAYSTSDGAVIWDFNTAREYETVNGEKGKGGSLDGPGPTVVDGMLYVNSGYGLFRGLAGNVLLAFSVDGK